MILFICTGNICRSPSAEGILKHMLKDKNKDIYVDSAALAAWHVGSKPDNRAIKVAADYGFDISMIKARQMQKDDYYNFTEIIAMDKSHYGHLIAYKPKDAVCHISYFCDWFKQEKSLSIKDPYYGSEEDFDVMMKELIEGCKKIAETLS